MAAQDSQITTSSISTNNVCLKTPEGNGGPVYCTPDMDPACVCDLTLDYCKHAVTNNDWTGTGLENPEKCCQLNGDSKFLYPVGMTIQQCSPIIYSTHEPDKVEENPFTSDQMIINKTEPFSDGDYLCVRDKDNTILSGLTQKTLQSAMKGTNICRWNGGHYVQYHGVTPPGPKPPPPVSAHPLKLAPSIHGRR